MKRIRLHRIMAFVPAGIIISLLLLAPSSKNENVVVHINGMPVPVAEFELFQAPIITFSSNGARKIIQAFGKQPMAGKLLLNLPGKKQSSSL